MAENNMSVDEMRQWYADNRQNIENFAIASDAAKILRDVTQGIDTRNIQTINKSEFKGWLKSIGSNEKRLRDTSRYLYYRSNVFFRIVSWYATMFNLDARIVTPPYNISKSNSAKTMLQSFEKTLDYLDILNNQGNLLEAFTNVFIDDVFYAVRYSDNTGSFYFPLSPEDCVIDGKYSDGSFSFAVNMGKWGTKKRRAIIEKLGGALQDMLDEYDVTKKRYIHCPDRYAFCLKFHTDTWDTNIPPLLSLLLSIANLSDLEDVQAEADQLNIYKLIYMPMAVHSNSKNANDFEVSPDVAKKYFKKILDDGVIPANIGAAMVPADELKVIDFDNTADSDTTSVSKAQDQVLATGGGGAVINSSNITSTAAFNAWLKAETEFAISPLLPQIDGITKRFLFFEVGNDACSVRHFPISVYTQKDFADQFLQSNQYSYSYRLAYGTLINVKEKETLALLKFENNVLRLPELMKYPLTSSFTSSTTEDGYTTEVGQGRPSVADDQLTPEGDRSRNQ